MRTYLSLLFIVVCILTSQLSSSQVFQPTVKRIIFLGNSITWAGNYVNDIAAYLNFQSPQQKLEIINLGLPSETVSGLSEPGHAGGNFPRPDLHERLQRILQQTKPDLVFACYGMNDGIYLPLDDNRFQSFKNGIKWLHNEVVKSGATIVHLTPPYYDEVRGKSLGYSKVLDKYADWLISMKKTSNWGVVDVHYPMKKYLLAHRKVDEKYALEGFALAADGVHPGELGHWIIAREVLNYIGYKQVARSPSVTSALSQLKPASEYVKMVSERQNILRDAWLTATKHTRPGLPIGLPLREAEQKIIDFQTKIDSLIRTIH